MTVKEFFKSTAFKCIVALLCVLLVSGIFLTVMSSLLQVTEQEKFDRAINKIYGKSVKYETVAVQDYSDTATINEAYKIKDDGNYLIKATGKGGYDNGTVTCWVVVEIKGSAISGIGKVVIDSNKNQSYIANISNAFLSGFATNFTGDYYNATEGFVKTGATFSATAICNAVNGAMDFVNAKFGNLAADPFEKFAYTANIDKRNTSFTVDENKVVTYTITTYGFKMAAPFDITIKVGTDKKILSYEITKNGSTGGYEAKMNSQILNGKLFVGKGLADITAILDEGMEYPGDKSGNAVLAGASNSNYVCIYAAAFATANYDNCMPAPAEGEEEPTEGGQVNE